MCGSARFAENLQVSSSDLSDELQALYDRVPATRCAHSGECCSLTEAEFDADYATMFPLYSAEYRNIVGYVESGFEPDRQGQLLSFTEERPRQCPFLGTDQNCTIYPVRPLICRTYGVMNLQAIAVAAAATRGAVPTEWVDRFVRRESGMVCPRVSVVEPEKLEQHAIQLVTAGYERVLSRLSSELELAAGERRTIFRRATWGRAWPVRWTWGGFNAVCSAPLEWMRSSFKSYWRGAALADAQ